MAVCCADRLLLGVSWDNYDEGGAFLDNSTMRGLEVLSIGALFEQCRTDLKFGCSLA